MNFLTILRPGGGLIVLSANKPDTDSWPTRTFELPAEQAEAETWCANMAAAGHNIYYQHAIPSHRFASRMPKTGIDKIAFLHADLDWKEASGKRLKASPEMKAAKIAELHALELPPSIVADSGNGLQALWRLKEPVSAEQAERACKALSGVLGADAGTWNADRLLRLPGFTNWPDAKKRKAGLVPVQTALIEANATAYGIDAFPTASAIERTIGGAADVDCDIKEMGEAELEALGLSASLVRIIREGSDPDSTNPPRDNSRSGWLMKAVSWLVHIGVDDGAILGILLNTDWEISASVYDAKGRPPEAYARRQVARAKSHVGEPSAMEEFGLPETGTLEDEDINTEELTPQEQKELKAAALAKAKGDEKERAATSKAKASLARKKKLRDALKDWVYASEPTTFVRRSDKKLWGARQFKPHFMHLHPKIDEVALAEEIIPRFERLVFEPGAPEELGWDYNLWRPSAIEAAQGDPGWFLDHIAFLFLDPAEADMVLDYLALLVRLPAIKIQFALLIFGEPGIGKSFLGALLAALLGPDNVIFPSHGDIMASWTEWQEGKSLAFINELMTGNSSRAANRLKEVITEPGLRISAKYRSTYNAPNRLNILAMSNESQALTLARNDRRWLVLHTKAKRAPSGYYDALWAKLRPSPDKTALGAVLHMLKTRDVKLNPNEPPPFTGAKQAMIEETRDDETAYLYGLLERGAVPFDFDLVHHARVVDALRREFPSARDVSRKVSAFLRECGAVKFDKPGARAKENNITLWCIRNTEKWQAAGPAKRAQSYWNHSNCTEGAAE